MAATPGRRSSRQTLRVETGQIIAADNFAGRIENMQLTPEGTLRSIRGPLPFIPNYATQQGSTGYPAYGDVRAIFHATLHGGSREILLIQNDNTILEFQGWNPYTVAFGPTGVWRYLMGPSSVSPAMECDIVDDDKPRYPTQFEAVSNGVIIVPQDRGSAWFYDGYVIAQLGYTQRPGAPTLAGITNVYATNEDASADEANAAKRGYVHTGETIHPDWGIGRIGTPRGPADAGAVSGIIEEGAYYGAIQWIDRWGNLSALSEKSAAARVAQDYTDYRVDLLLQQLGWTSIEAGPAATIGRILCRTKDTLHSGTEKFFEIPPNGVGGTPAESTIPDNFTTIYPDNTPDSWLIREPLDVRPFPPVHLIRQGFGRLFVASGPQLLWSEIGLWGTVLRDSFLYPDSGGRDISGIGRMATGMLVFTEFSTYLIVPSDDGKGFKSNALNTRVGCVAPNSIQTMQNGVTIWLAHDGFYAYDGTEFAKISDTIASQLRRMNHARRLQAVATINAAGEYVCWMAIDGSRVNNIAFVYDGEGWRRRTDMLATFDVVTTKDHRQYTLVAGSAKDSTPTTRMGVWLLDHAVTSYTPFERTAIVETAWLATTRSDVRRTSYRALLWLREFSTGTLTVTTHKNYRDAVVDTFTAQLRPGDDTETIPVWDATVYAGYNAQGQYAWQRRRPFWQRVEIYIPSCETFKLKISGTSSWELIALEIEETERGSGMAQTPP